MQIESARAHEIRKTTAGRFCKLARSVPENHVVPAFDLTF